MPRTIFDEDGLARARRVEGVISSGAFEEGASRGAKTRRTQVGDDFDLEKAFELGDKPGELNFDK